MASKKANEAVYMFFGSFATEDDVVIRFARRPSKMLVLACKMVIAAPLALLLLEFGAHLDQLVNDLGCTRLARVAQHCLKTGDARVLRCRMAMMSCMNQRPEMVATSLEMDLENELNTRRVLFDCAMPARRLENRKDARKKGKI
jgi:hypothetical protein